MIRRFARPYARAIMDVTGSPAAANELRQQLEQFDAQRAKSVELQDFYANPGFESDAKTKVTAEIAKRLGLSDLAVKVLDVLIRNHRINDLGAINDALVQYVNDALQIAVADVRTAHALNQDEQNELRQTLEKKLGKKVELQLTTDPTLLGGFVAQVGSEIWDASVAGKINKFRASLA
ncbi:MAG TPA: ATP synthase F1 subunit delta [Thermoanaerobaculia bacterium]|nr:ATP synthase F1 subunit delta [Thermoanaerobaculia bacterium]